MKKLIKLCAVLLLLVAVDTRAADQTPNTEFISCLAKYAPTGFLREFSPDLLNDGPIHVQEVLDRANARKEGKVSGCANTLFKAYSAEPDHPLKSAKLNLASACYKTLRSLELFQIDDAEAAQAMIIANNQILQEVKAYNDKVKAYNDKLLKAQQAAAQRKQQEDEQRARAAAYIRRMEEIERKYADENNALIQQYIDRVNSERNRQSWFDAARIINEVTKPVIVPQPVDNSMNCRAYRNGNEIITNCR